ncbi:hypothetical protein, partial [Pontibacter qinzhouensis]|uniref:hypothetical protein n=1 Tax=Pontibacter qinzhouensis TaxID=2603253 RepID=UPI001C9C4B9C
MLGGAAVEEREVIEPQLVLLPEDVAQEGERVRARPLYRLPVERVVEVVKAPHRLLEVQVAGHAAEAVVAADL